MIKIALGFLVGLICVIFFFQNGEISNISFFNLTFSLPLYLIALIFFVSGVFLGWLLTSFGSLKKRKRNK